LLEQTRKRGVLANGGYQNVQRKGDSGKKSHDVQRREVTEYRGEKEERELYPDLKWKPNWRKKKTLQENGEKKKNFELRN